MITLVSWDKREPKHHIPPYWVTFLIGVLFVGLISLIQQPGIFQKAVVTLWSVLVGRVVYSQSKKFVPAAFVRFLAAVSAKAENEFPMVCTSIHLLCARSNQYISSSIGNRARIITKGAPMGSLLNVNSSHVLDAQFELVFVLERSPTQRKVHGSNPGCTGRQPFW